MVFFVTGLVLSLCLFELSSSYGQPGIASLSYSPAYKEKLVFIFDNPFGMWFSKSEEHAYGSIMFIAWFNREYANVFSETRETDRCNVADHPYKFDTWQPVHNIASVWVENEIYYYTVNNFSGNYTEACDSTASSKQIVRLNLEKISESYVNLRALKCTKN